MNESFKNSEFILDATHSVGDIIYNVYNQGYEDGLKDGKESVQINESTPAAYEAGLEAAWELARKLYNLGFNDTRKEIFGEKYGLSIDIYTYKMRKLRERFEDFCAEECAICAMHTKDGCGLINDYIKKEGTYERKTES